MATQDEIKPPEGFSGRGRQPAAPVSLSARLHLFSPQTLPVVELPPRCPPPQLRLENWLQRGQSSDLTWDVDGESSVRMLQQVIVAAASGCKEEGLKEVFALRQSRQFCMDLG